jgi:hypothetical protein
MGCRRVPAGYVLFVPVLFMWNVVVLLLMHLLGAADCVVASYQLSTKGLRLSIYPCVRFFQLPHSRIHFFALHCVLTYITEA